MYHPAAYFLAKNLVETPVACLTPLIMLTIMYWGIGYTHYFLVYIGLISIAQTSMGVGIFISAIAPNVTTATAIAPVFTMPFILFGGFIANTDTLPDWLGWV